MNPIEFSSFLDSISKQPLHVLDASIPLNTYTHLDLSVHNTELNTIDVSSSSVLEVYIQNYIKSKHVLVAFGGYNETRNIYQRSTHFNNQNTDNERNIHLGVDLWVEANSPIFTPLEAEVHSFKNNTNYGDYGPTIILKHEVNTIEFYTLYGHLSLSSIENLHVGQKFKQGQHIATLGDASVNGDYPPHLHFQIIRDIQDYKGDYPGVCSTQDLAFYLANCPNPNVLLKIN